MESALRRGAGAPGLKLIETLGWDGAVLVRLERHLARLERSAGLLGWGCDLAAVRAVLATAVPEGPARMRLTLDAAGAVVVEATALPPMKPVWRVGFAAARLSSDDPWLAVKSTRREGYDAARAVLPAGLDEVVFLNERGEVCDGTISTLFFDAGEGLRTPPVTCGLLPGVLRGEMLERRACREAVLQGSDLGHVRLWMGNSLRGLIAAEWVEGN